MQTFFIRQKITPLANQYTVYEAGAKDVEEQLVAFVHQKRFAFREKFELYTDESKSKVFAEVQARQAIDLGARYDVKDAKGKLVGVVGKVFGASLFNSTWHVFAPGDEEKPRLIVRERSPVLAIIRRVWELLPIIGEIPFFVKYHFDFTDPKSEEVKASYEKVTTFTDHYRLDIKDAVGLDPKLFIAMGVMLDALQSR